MIENQDDVALLPPGPRGDRNCCALTTTQTRLLTLGMPSVEPPYSHYTACADSPASLGDSGWYQLSSGRQAVDARARSVGVADLDRGARPRARGSEYLVGCSDDAGLAPSPSPSPSRAPGSGGGVAW
jgi:hypothetical protein